MAYIQINGVDLPSPKRGVKPTVVTFVDSGRNANAAVVGQKIGRDQYKLDTLEWPWLSCYEWAYILQLLSPFFVNVTFIDPVTTYPITIKMYPGDRSAEPYYVDGNEEPTFYQNCKVNLIDCGE